MLGAIISENDSLIITSKLLISAKLNPQFSKLIAMITKQVLYLSYLNRFIVVSAEAQRSASTKSQIFRVLLEGLLNEHYLDKYFVRCIRLQQLYWSLTHELMTIDKLQKVVFALTGI